jgi:transposase
MLKKVERSSIKLLKGKGVNISKIARLTDRSRPTVRRVLREPTDKEYQRSSMTSIVDKFYKEDIKRWIREDIPVKRMCEKAREDEDHPYEGSTSNFYDRVRKIRGEVETEEDAVVRFETLPGEQLQIDWGEANIDYDEDEEKTEYFFTARMKYSRYMYVEVRDNMKLETLINCILHAFEDLGGVPLSLSFDNMKTVVKEIDEDNDPVWNETFFKFATEMGFHPIACEVDQPNQKGSVENLVKYVKSNFLPGRIFSDREDMEKRLEDWLVKVNEERECKATERIPAELLEERELEKLQPLKATSNNYGLLRYLTVTREGTVNYQTNEYSVPVELIGKTVEARIHPDRVRIYHEGEKVADHERSTGRKQRVREPDHYEPTFKKKPRAQVMLYREKLLSLNHGISDYVEKVVRKNVANQRPHVIGIYDLLEDHGKEKLSKLCRKCADRNLYGIDYLEAYLEDGEIEEEKEEVTENQEELTLTGLPDQTEVDRSMDAYEKLAKGGGS